MGSKEDPPQGQESLVQPRLAEFSALRGEILFHLESQRKILLGVWTLAGVFFAFASKSGPKELLLSIPVIVLAGGLHWAHAANAIMKIGAYIHNNLENELPGLDWQHHLKRAKRPSWTSMAWADQWAPMLSAFVIGLVAVLLWAGDCASETEQIERSRQWILVLWHGADWVLVFLTPFLFRWRS